MNLEAPISVSEIAKSLNKTFIGNAKILITGINEINRSQKGDLIFVDHPKYYNKAIKSEATVLLINSSKIKLPTEKAAILSSDPFCDFNALLKKHQKINNSNKVKTLICGNNTFIHPSVIVGKYVNIGDNCTIHPNVVLYDNVRIGNNTIIHANTIIGTPAFYFQRKENKYHTLHTCGEVIIGDNVEIGASNTIDAGVTHITSIGNGTKTDNQVHIGHDCLIGENCLMAAQVGIAGCNNIEDNVILWGQVGIPSNLTIGKGAILLGQSAPSKNVPPGKVMLGSPASESMKKFKELAALKQLPEILKKKF